MNAPEKDVEGYGTTLQCSPVCLENSMDREAWWATVHGGCKESDTTEQPSLIPEKEIRAESLSLEYTRTVAGRGWLSDIIR